MIIFKHKLQRRVDRDPELSNICVLGTDPGTMITLNYEVRRGLSASYCSGSSSLLSPFWNRKGLFELRNSQHSTPYRPRLTIAPCLEKFPKHSYFYARETSIELRDAQKRELVWKTSVRLAQLKEGEMVLSDWQ